MEDNPLFDLLERIENDKVIKKSTDIKEFKENLEDLKDLKKYFDSKDKDKGTL